VRITRIITRLNVGGPAVHIAGLMAGLDPCQFESRLIVGRSGRDEGDMSYLIGEESLPRPTVIPELGRRISPLSDLVTVCKLVPTLRRQRPHIVETHTAKAGFVGRLAARLTGVPVVLHVLHGHVFYGYFGRLQTRAYITTERLMARLSDRIVTISESQRHDIAHVYRIAPANKVFVVPLGFDLNAFVKAKETAKARFRALCGLSADAPLVGFVGRLTSVKNPALFVHAARRVLEETPEAHFCVVGDGELRQDVERQVAALGIADRVHLAGWQRDMPAVYAALDVLVLTSLNEGTPVTAIEALAAGVPVVATDVGGVADVVRDKETGFLVPPGDAGALARSVSALLSDTGRGHAMAQAGQQDVLARFGRDRLIADMEELYLSLLKEKRISV
jgi:glycosyltransferase involved in cell wall biosynthesis